MHMCGYFALGQGCRVDADQSTRICKSREDWERNKLLGVADYKNGHANGSRPGQVEQRSMATISHRERSSELLTEDTNS